MFSQDLLTRSQHSTLIIDGKLYSWGGSRPNLPLVHDSVEKKSLTSFVEVFDIPSLSWSRVSTLSIPPAAVREYSCGSINDTVYYFGGNCMPDDCYHNDLFALNTTSKEWNHVLYANEKNTPMTKIAHSMIAFKSNKEDYLLIIGGLGPLPASTYMCSHAVYRPSPSTPNYYYTNETHILCVSSLPAQWTLPEVTGMPPPPIAWCSVNTLPSSNRAVLFGGMVIDDNGLHRSNDVYIITYTENQVNYAKLDYSPLDYCPKGRCGHSSSILRANGTHHLLVVGGFDDNLNTTSDCWILDIDKRNWRKIDVPDSATRRYGHSISSFPVSDNCVWIIITGGDLQHIRKTKSGIFVRGPYITVITELVYSNGEWSVTGMWNNELIANHSIRLTLLDKLREGTISGALVPDETEQLRKKLEEEKKKNDQLKSDLRESQTRNAHYLKRLVDNRKELERVQEIDEGHKKTLIQLSHKLDKLRRMKDSLLDSGSQPDTARKRTNDEPEYKPKKKKHRISDDDGEESEHSVQDKLEGTQETIEEQAVHVVVTEEVQRVDIGIQFNYVSLQIDHLQGLTVYHSKLFTVHGNRPQSLIWEGHGFELHFPANTCLPSEECDIMVDAVVGGDFVFPEGVEPVSAIYIISITSKLRMPSLLKIQHCVALDKASKHSRLSFYRALLKEPKPPYHFEVLEGGKFDTSDQFGELDLPMFCAMVIGKNSSIVDDDSNNNRQSVEGNNTSLLLGFSEMEQDLPVALNDKDEFQPADTVSLANDFDDSIMYSCQVFYSETGLNKWQLIITVVKNIQVFTSYVKRKFKECEADVAAEMRFSDSKVEFVLTGGGVSDFKGWRIEPNAEPLALMQKFSSQFGYEKEVSVPPTCLLTVVGDNSVPDYTKRLHCPVLLRGALIGVGEQESMIFIKRTMSEKDARNRQIINLIKEEISKSLPVLRELSETNLEAIVKEMIAATIVPYHFASNPSFHAIMDGFFSGLLFMESVEEIESWCNSFLTVFSSFGESYVVVVNNIKKQLQSSLMNEFGISFNI